MDTYRIGRIPVRPGGIGSDRIAADLTADHIEIC